MVPNITVRFAYQSYAAKKLKLGVEFLSSEPNQWLFGMNVRFFYDATFFEPGTKENVKFLDYASGYGLQNQASIGTGAAGGAWFKMPTAPVTYVNWAVQLFSPSKPIYISTNPFEWTRLFSVELTTKNVLVGDNYPILIWDIETDPYYGGFMPNAEGCVMVTVADPSGAVRTQPTNEYASHFNWKATLGARSAPWGIPVQNNLIRI